jgi:hypothetical protein
MLDRSLALRYRAAAGRRRQGSSERESCSLVRAIDHCTVQKQAIARQVVMSFLRRRSWIGHWPVQDHIAAAGTSGGNQVHQQGRVAPGSGY